MILTDSQRRYFYRVALSLVVAAQFFRLLPDDSFDVIANVVSAVFGITAPALALPNVPKPAND
jgi:hypothetical protein